ncbi:DUF3105 domain-containing protein [Streptomyces sp. NPDC051896]|uniref:DUF3105 domain-containing protein n=1 Tax=Streptomyces sp. NPDC051896 TaxID=3155416 RepID=UPI003445A6A5
MPDAQPRRVLTDQIWPSTHRHIDEIRNSGTTVSAGVDGLVDTAGVTGLAIRAVRDGGRVASSAGGIQVPGERGIETRHTFVPQYARKHAELDRRRSTPTAGSGRPTGTTGGTHLRRGDLGFGNVYTQPLQNGNAVHSLEHGAVWVTYNTKATNADVKALGAKVQKTPYTLMSPYPSESSPITLSAWGHQLNVTKASDPRVNEFFDKYVQGKQTPEPGAACTGGKSS